MQRSCSSNIIATIAPSLPCSTHNAFRHAALAYLRAEGTPRIMAWQAGNLRCVEYTKQARRPHRARANKSIVTLISRRRNRRNIARVKRGCLKLIKAITESTWHSMNNAARTRAQRRETYGIA